MNFKKFALRGLIILAVAVALCILFSGTIRTLTTPKVRYAPVKMGKFENVTELTGKVVFPEKEDVTIDVPDGLSLTVTRVLTEPGKQVREGDKLLTAVVTDADKTLETLQQDIDSERESLNAWERKNGTIRLSRNEQNWVGAGIAAREAEKAERAARLDLLSRLEAYGLKEIPETLPENADDTVNESFAAWQAADAELTSARKTLASLDRYAVADDIWTLLKQKQEHEQKLADAEDRMMQIMLLSRKAEVITAPHDGYIIEVNVEKDAVITGGIILLSVTPENQEPVIRSELPDLKLSVQKGTSLTIPSDSWGYAETRVINTGMTSTGHPYIDAQITDDVIYSIGDVATIMKDDIKLRLTTKAKESTCLLPASAVRGSGDSRYVYVGEIESSALAGTRITVQKVSVTVLSESASTISIAEDMSWYKVLYMEDRVINEGGTVMLYEE